MKMNKEDKQTLQNRENLNMLADATYRIMDLVQQFASPVPGMTKCYYSDGLTALEEAFEFIIKMGMGTGNTVKIRIWRD